MDLELVVVEPDGSVFRNDDTGGLLPEVRIDPVSDTGWHAVSVGTFDGNAANSTFTLAYGRYDGGNANCASPTPELVDAARVPAK